MLRQAMPLRAIAGLSVLLGLLLLAPLAVHAQDAQPTAATTATVGYTYVVQKSDTWARVARRTGISMAELKRLNPHARHANDWLWVGDLLFIPVPVEATPAPTAQPTTQSTAGATSQPAEQATLQPPAGYWYQVKPGDSWTSLSRATGITVKDLWLANPSKLRPNRWLYIGQWLRVPMPQPSAEPTLAPTPTTPSIETTATPEPTPTATATASPTATSPAVSLPCPTAFSRFPSAIASYLEMPGSSPEGLANWLRDCGVTDPETGGVSQADLQGSGVQDLAVALVNKEADEASPPGLLLVYHRKPAGYVQAYLAEGAGAISFLAGEDLNLDGKPDLVFTDTTCGAHTCFTTLFVESWDGSGYRDWIEGEPSMAEGSYSFEDTEAAGKGKEILAHGGIINSAGAGPQRAYTESFVSTGGGPYVSLKQEYDQPSCLYHAIVDANDRFALWNTEGFEPAIAAYRAALAEADLAACGTIEDELATLRDFARVRLAIALVAGGAAKDAPALRDAITDPTLRDLADVFLSSYKDSGSIVQACRDTTVYAENNSETWDFLADWGYTNPTFSADALCPLD